MKLLVRRKPQDLVVERWDGPGYYVIPDEHSLHGNILRVAAGDFIAKPRDGDWYPLKAEVLCRDFEIQRVIGE